MNRVKHLTFLLIAIVCLFLLPANAFCKTNINLDIATFHYNNGQSLTELYYAIPVNELQFTHNQTGGLQAEVMIRLTAKKDDELWVNDSWKMEKSITDSSELDKSLSMVDIIRYIVEPGKYDYTLYVQDLNNETDHVSIEKEIVVDLYPSEQLDLSDILLASSIKKSELDTNNVFWKSGYEIIPIPGSVFNEQTPLLYYYLESYNLNKVLPESKYKSKAYITAPDGKVTDIKPRMQQKNGLSSNVEIGLLHIAELPSGAYNFNYDIYDNQDSLLTSTTKRFFVYNPTIAAAPEQEYEIIESAIQASELAPMNSKELDAEFELTQYFTTREQKDFYKELKEADAKRRYIYELWKSKDPTPETIENDYKLEYKRRVNYANENFRSYARKGWKTDRGRVFILYGPPTDVEKNPNNPTTYAHEIWHYDTIEGGVIFVFADFQEFGEYLQIHSTKLGEPINNNWKDSITK